MFLSLFVKIFFLDITRNTIVIWETICKIFWEHDAIRYMAWANRWIVLFWMPRHHWTLEGIAARIIILQLFYWYDGTSLYELVWWDLAHPKRKPYEFRIYLYQWLVLVMEFWSLRHKNLIGWINMLPLTSPQGRNTLRYGPFVK